MTAQHHSGSHYRVSCFPVASARRTFHGHVRRDAAVG